MRIHYPTVSFWTHFAKKTAALATTARTKLRGQYVPASKQAEGTDHTIWPIPARFKSTAGIKIAEMSKSPRESKATHQTEDGSL